MARGRVTTGPVSSTRTGPLVTYRLADGRWITQRCGGSGSGKNSDLVRLNRETFAAVTQLIKNPAPEDYNAAITLAKGTLKYPRDVMAMAAYGTLIVAHMADGTTKWGERELATNVQAMLDSISSVAGSMLYRSPDQWIALPAGNAGDVVTTDKTTLLPAWQPITLTNAQISAALDEIGSDVGTILVRSTDGWVAIDPGTATNVLTSNGAGEVPTWQPQSGGGGGSGALTELANVVLTADEAYVEFAAISQNYETLLLSGSVRCTASSTRTDLLLTCNGDTAAHYTRQYKYQSNGSVNFVEQAGQTGAAIAYIPSASATEKWFATFDTRIPAYAQSDRYKQGVGTMVADVGDDTAWTDTAWHWASQAAITSIRLTPASGSLLSGSRVSLYGLTI